MALVEKNMNLKGKKVKLDGLTISWDDEEDAEPVEGLELEPEDDKLSEKKILKTKNDDLKTRKVVI
jgi:hypothetical protein